MNQVPRYGHVSENEKVELWRYSPYNLEDSMGISVLHTILSGVSILVMFDWRFDFELRPNLSGVRFFGVGRQFHTCRQFDALLDEISMAIRTIPTSWNNTGFKYERRDNTRS
jgi:hypothetical protein